MAAAAPLPAPATPPPLDAYRCGLCAYGIAVAGEPQVRCPMCGAIAWHPTPQRSARAR